MRRSAETPLRFGSRRWKWAGRDAGQMARPATEGHFLCKFLLLLDEAFVEV